MCWKCLRDKVRSGPELAILAPEASTFIHTGTWGERGVYVCVCVYVHVCMCARVCVCVCVRVCTDHPVKNQLQGKDKLQWKYLAHNELLHFRYWSRSLCESQYLNTLFEFIIFHSEGITTFPSNSIAVTMAVRTSTKPSTKSTLQCLESAAVKTITSGQANNKETKRNPAKRKLWKMREAQRVQAVRHITHYCINYIRYARGNPWLKTLYCISTWRNETLNNK